ncbi:MAG: zinc metalloprotease HtpX [Alphaproteobacteria bacterium]|nr:zinc metalloprotease HtpX [Alphaproteobacteria bacterium]
MNYFRTALLLAALTAFFLAIGFMVGGEGGMILALVVAMAMNLFAYWNSDRMVLSMSHARAVGPEEAPQFHGIVAELAQRAGLPMPKVYIVDEAQPNAFATGRSPERAAVAATSGLLQNLSREEIAGVMAHELAHVKNRDTLIMTVAATISGAIGMIASFGGMFGGARDENGRPMVNPIVAMAAMILAPLAASLVQMAISRSREYEADRVGAEICGNPLWLASALANLHRGTQALPNHAAEANPATAHMYIANPLSGGGLASLFSTHPPMEERVARLEAMAQNWRGGGGQRGWPGAPAPAPRATTRGRSSIPQSGDERSGPWR